MICYWIPEQHTFKIIKDHDFSSPLFTRSTQRTDKTYGGDIIPTDDMFNGVSGEIETNRAWLPSWGVVCHGLLVMRCNVSEWSGRRWYLTGTGIASFAINASTGTLSLLRRDFFADPDPTWGSKEYRGNYWATTGYTPDPHYTDPPLAAWFAFTDYTSNSEDNKSPGGYALVMRATRSSVSSAWVPEQAVMIHSCIFVELTGNPSVGNTLTITGGSSSYIFEFGNNSGGHIAVTIGANATATVNNLITAINANIPSNGMTRAVKDPSGDIATIQGVLSADKDGTNIVFAKLGRHFHSAVVQVKSSTTIDVLLSIGDFVQNQSIVLRCTDKANYTSLGNWTAYNHGIDGLVNQWAGGVLGPDNNHIVGADGTSETIISAKTPDANVDPSVTKASLDYLFGTGTSASDLMLSLWVHTDCPEKARNYVSRSMKGDPNGTAPDESICFSPDGRAWCMIANMPSGTEIPFVCGDRIYLTSLVGSGGIRYIPIPKTRIARPLRIGPGGRQWVQAADWTVDQIQPGILATPLNQAPNGNWQDNGVDLPSQPPTRGRVLKVTNSGTNTYEGRNWIAGYWEDFPSTPVVNGKVFLRWWGMPFKGRQSAVTGYIDSATSPNGTGDALTQFSTCPGTFTPQLLTGNIPNNTYSRWLHLDGVDQNENFYFASDLFVTGENPVPGYPMPEGRNTTNPDEQLTISDLGLGSQWTVAVYCIMPWDSWDSRYSYFDGTSSHPMVDEVPLWTLYANSSSAIAVVADIANNKLLVRMTAPAWSQTLSLDDVKYWRCYPVVVCISRIGNNIEVSARIVGNIKTKSATGVIANTPTEIRFGSPNWSRVTALDVAHVSIDTTQALDDAGRALLMAEAAAPLTLVSVSFYESENQLILTFDRPVDISNFDGTQVTVKEGLYWNSEARGTTASLIDDNTVQVDLEWVADYNEPMQVLTVTALSGIASVEDGGTWAGVTDLVFG